MVKEKILVKFGQKVKELRLKQNISQEKLAEKANVHRTYIGMIERAEKNITLINIEKIAKAIVLRKNIQDTQLQNKTKQNKL
ncbi:MAG: helix-turn-helix transcriptional regulator [Geminocystis sp. GBBB08]|nr:helix-turn-helix transcriptional regulator [Geminocystis sp. GBBB08]